MHESHKNSSNEVKNYWSFATGFPRVRFGKIYYKKNKINTKRKNVGINYHGLVRVKVTKSSEINRKIAGWIEAICLYCGVV